MKLSLEVMTEGKQQGKRLPIGLPQFIIGRDPQCQLRPASPSISKRHCAVIQRDGRAFVRDFDSTNGTFVNDNPVKGERELHHDDQLKIGPIEFTVRMEAAPARTNTPAPATKATLKTPAPGSKPTPSKSDTPVPATAPKGGAEDDDIAAMLMSLEEGEQSSGGDGVPEGSTVFDLKVPAELGPPGSAPADQKSAAPAKASGGDTRSAAAKILERMTKRPRT